ncbi:ABC transporter substrate-binding protein [Lichenicoccus roseus]|uniref:ABC transporter substrate-binding protein n=2 Tax=Lichenicoccus roseus TaxID=2683649 RepID=A0A5R9J737_9PROT|nr:ABC transporter substrate-binding protein [Lichenicoccus roseus]
MIGADSMHDRRALPRGAVPRRRLGALAGAVALCCGMAMAGTPARAESADVAFVHQFGDKLVAVINGPGSAAEKRQQIQPLIDRNVDVDGIAKFAMGRYWKLASPTQQQQFVTLFHHVLLNTITSRLGEYQGVRFSVGADTPHGNGQTQVATTIDRPGQPSADVDWVLGHAGGAPRVEDVFGEGVSLSLTQRQDYASYLSRNGNDIDKLLDAMRRQAARSS